jgi:hypothetical protein
MSLLDASVVSENFGEFSVKLAFAVLRDESRDLEWNPNIRTYVFGHGEHDDGVENVRRTCFVRIRGFKKNCFKGS